MNAVAEENLVRLEAALAPFRGKPVWYDRLHGNHGDTLIVMGGEHAIRATGCELTADPGEAEAIFVVGGAGLSSVWGGAYGRVEKYMTGELGAKPLVVFPSTMSFEANDFADLVNRREGPSTLIARERPTLARMREVEWSERVRCGLDHDTAFRLTETPWFDELMRRREDRHLLIVERRDAESLTNVDGAVPAPSLAKRLAPTFLKRAIKRTLHRRARGRGPFYEWALEESRETFGESSWLGNVVPLDVSVKAVVTFQQFLDSIVHAGGVVTTRLHVGILAGMLGKPTLLVGGDPKYAKISGIYEHSMRDMPHVKFVENPFHR